jgi:hypothetical protein
MAKMNPGDVVSLEVQGNTVLALSAAGDALGKIEPKLRQRLIRLTNMGNQYTAVVTSVDEQSLRIIIRETYRDPAMGNRPSFPTTGEVFRGYVRDSLLRYDLEDEEEEDEEMEEAEHDREPDAVAEDLPIDEAAEAAADDDEEEDQ